MATRHVEDLSDEAFVRYYLEFVRDMERRRTERPSRMAELLHVTAYEAEHPKAHD